MTARELLERAHADIERLEDVRASIELGGITGGRRGGGHGSGISDPTATAAAYRVDVLEGRLADLEAEERGLEDSIGEVLELVEGVRRGLGGRYGYVLEARYVDGWSWPRVAECSEAECGASLSERTCRRLRDVACDWVDFRGVAYVAECAHGVDNHNI